MPKALSLKTIKARIAKLEAQARKVSAAEKPGLKAAIALIKKHKLSLSDISAALGKSGKLVVGGAKSSAKRATKKAKIKFRDGDGNTWSGRGLAPKWLVAAEKAGKKREGFAV